MLDLTTFFLHRAVAKLPENKRAVLLDLHHSDKILTNKKVLIVDDDMRNIFALSTVLEEHEMVIVSADNGRCFNRDVLDGVRRHRIGPQRHSDAPARAALDRRRLDLMRAGEQRLASLGEQPVELATSRR